MIECYDLVKIFDGELKISYSDISFEKGKRYLILGESGCGKSTLLNMISGITLPTEGYILIDGKDITAMKPSERDNYRVNNIGYIYQDYKLLEEMTVEDNLRVLELATDIDRRRLNDCLCSMGIRDKWKTKVKLLSGGQKQRVAIVRSLVKEPDILLADEPTGNLNFEIGLEVIKDLISCTEDKYLIVVSHDERLIPYFTDIIRLDDVSRSETEADGT